MNGSAYPSVGSFSQDLFDGFDPFKVDPGDLVPGFNEGGSSFYGFSSMLVADRERNRRRSVSPEYQAVLPAKSRTPVPNTFQNEHSFNTDQSESDRTPVPNTFQNEHGFNTDQSEVPTLYRPIKWSGVVKKLAWTQPGSSTGKRFENVTFTVSDGLWTKPYVPYVSTVEKKEIVNKYIGDGLKNPESDSPAPNEQTITVKYNSFYPPGFKKSKIINCEGFVISEKYYDRFIMPFLRKSRRL
uniref:Uncharacterized protein n=1 Tax=Panagrolaimus sp. JU765 TaxID=591449 RepID=A0AC34R1M4_9BILA